MRYLVLLIAACGLAADSYAGRVYVITDTLQGGPRLDFSLNGEEFSDSTTTNLVRDTWQFRNDGEQGKFRRAMGWNQDGLTTTYNTTIDGQPIESRN